MRFWQSTAAGGGLVDPGEAAVINLGSNSNNGLFETLRTEGVEVEFVDLHLERFTTGLKSLGLPDSLLSECEKAIGALAAQLTPDLDLGRLRVGVAIQDQNWTCFATWQPAEVKPSVSMTIANVVRDDTWPLIGVKSLNRGHWDSLESTMVRRGADEILMVNEVGQVTETTRANLLIVKQGMVLTPSLDSGCLPGVIRRVLLEAGAIVEHPLTPGDLENSDGMFLTSAIRRVQPVHQFEERVLPILESIRTELVAVLTTRRRTS